MQRSQVFVLFFFTATTVAVFAQSKAGSTIPDRTVVRATLRTTIDARDAKLGKDLELGVTDDVRDDSGRILIPKQAKLIGRVTEAVQWTKDSPESRLAIIVERAEWKKTSVVLRAFIAGDLKIYTTAGNPKSGVSETVAAVTNVPTMQLPINPSLKQDSTVTVQMASKDMTSKDIVTELISRFHNVRVEQGSTFSLRQLNP